MIRAFLQERLGSLATPNLRWYWTNSVASAFGDSVTSIALMLMVLQETGSLSMMATMSIVVMVPGIVFGILSATWVDRWDAQRVVVMSQVVRAVLILGLVYVDISDRLWLAFGLAAVQSLVGTFDDPARARMIRAMTTEETRLSVNSLTTSGTMVASILGTTIGGTLVGSLDVYWPAFVVNSAAFLVGGLAISRIRDVDVQSHRGGAEGEVARFLDDVLGGIRAIGTSRVLSAVMITASASSIGLGAATIMLTPLIVNELRLSPSWFGLIEAGQSSATILVSLTIGLLGRKLDPRRLVVWGMVATGLVIALIGLAINVWMLVGAMFLVGLTITPVGSSYSTLLQTHAPKEMIGRVAAAMNTCFQTFSIASMAGAGFLGDLIGVRPVMWLAGGVCVVAGVVSAGMLSRTDGRPAEH